MKKEACCYSVEITEILQHTYFVLANSKEEAEIKAMENYKNCTFVLSAEDLKETKVEVT